MAKTITPGKVIITAITETANPNYMRVQLEQENKIEYVGEGDSPAFRLQNLVCGDAAPVNYDQKRYASQIVERRIVDQFAVGKEYPGAHIIWIKRSVPDYEGHNPAKDGSYITSEFSFEFKEDIDLRTTTTTNLERVSASKSLPALGTEDLQEEKLVTVERVSASNSVLNKVAQEGAFISSEVSDEF